ncbi:MAG TPA: hypothetical protein VMT58_03665 [Candidatus Binataceae bacterium]|nr:hypothetical protein [Candidatus Binataceae bacterium]
MTLRDAVPILFPLWGFILILAAYRRWSIFVDPPAGLWWRILYGNLQSMKRYGPNAIAYFTYAIGVGLIAISLLQWWLVIR